MADKKSEPADATESNILFSDNGTKKDGKSTKEQQKELQKVCQEQTNNF